MNNTTVPRNPDKRPLPPGWTQHYDPARNLWMYTQNNVSPPRLSLIHPASPNLPQMLPRPPSSSMSYAENSGPAFDYTPGRRRGASASVSSSSTTGKSGASFAQQLYASYAKPQTIPAPAPDSEPFSEAPKVPSPIVTRQSSPVSTKSGASSKSNAQSPSPLSAVTKPVLPNKMTFSPNRSAFGKLPEDEEVGEWSPVSLYNARIAPQKSHSASRPSTAGGSLPSQTHNHRTAPLHPMAHRSQSYQASSHNHPSPTSAHPHQRSATYSGGHIALPSEPRQLHSIAAAPPSSSMATTSSGLHSAHNVQQVQSTSHIPLVPSTSHIPQVQSTSSTPQVQPTPNIQQMQYASVSQVAQVSSPVSPGSSAGYSSPSPMIASPVSYASQSGPSSPLIQQQLNNYQASVATSPAPNLAQQVPQTATANTGVDGKAVGMAVGKAVGKAVLRGMFGVAGDFVGDFISDTVVDAAASAFGNDATGDIAATAVGAISNSLVTDGGSALTNTFVTALGGGGATGGLAESFASGMLGGGDPTAGATDALINSITSGIAGLSTGDPAAAFDPTSFITASAGSDLYQASQPNFADLMQQAYSQTNADMQQYQQAFLDQLNQQTQQAQQLQQVYQDQLNQQIQQIQQTYQNQPTQQQPQQAQQQQQQTYQPAQHQPAYQTPQNQVSHQTQSVQHHSQHGLPPGAGHYGAPGQSSMHQHSSPSQPQFNQTAHSNHIQSTQMHQHHHHHRSNTGFHLPNQSTTLAPNRYSLVGTNVPARNIIDPSISGLY